LETRELGRREPTQIMQLVGTALGVVDLAHLDGDHEHRLMRLSRLLAAYEMVTDNPIVNVVNHVGNYWRSWMLVILQTGTYRYSTIMKLLNAVDPSHPISQRMLTMGLRLLERDGLVERRVVEDVRRHVEYSLTPVGEELSERFMSLVEWIDSQAETFERSRSKYDAGQRPSAADRSTPQPAALAK
jgi:DNA-binding HxlR family transcriptional regulator